MPLSKDQRFKFGDTARVLKLIARDADGEIVDVTEFDAFEAKRRKVTEPRSAAVVIDEAEAVTPVTTHSVECTPGAWPVGRYFVELDIDVGDGKTRSVPGDKVGLEVEVFGDTG